jgi:hypothetical protein
MLAFLSSSAASFAPCLIQFAVGCALAFPACRLIKAARIPGSLRDGPGASALAAILASAACGALLPLGPWGAVPLAAAALAAGIGPELVLPFLSANLLFDSLQPFTDPTFIWRTGYARVLLALAAGSLVGLLARRMRPAALAALRVRSLPAAGGGARARFFLALLGAALACLAAGALAGTAFRRYGLGALVAFLFTNPATAFLPAFFAARNVVNPFFLLAMRILAALTDFTALAALALLLRPRGILAYFAYFAALAAILSISAFF